MCGTHVPGCTLWFISFTFWELPGWGKFSANITCNIVSVAFHPVFFLSHSYHSSSVISITLMFVLLMESAILPIAVSFFLNLSSTSSLNWESGPITSSRLDIFSSVSLLSELATSTCIVFRESFTLCNSAWSSDYMLSICLVNSVWRWLPTVGISLDMFFRTLCVFLEKSDNIFSEFHPWKLLYLCG